MAIPVDKCYLCGSMVSDVLSTISIRELTCPGCGAPKRTRDLVKVLMHLCLRQIEKPLNEMVGAFSDISIYETQAEGCLHDLLCRGARYSCSEYFDDVEGGGFNARGIQCQNLEQLTFDDNTFDIVISQDVFEHVRNPIAGFREIQRVLKPSGFHIFTVPLHEGRKTMSRKNFFDVYHGDPLREKGSLVFTDFGSDLPEFLEKQNIPTKIALHEKIYSEDCIPFIYTKDEFEKYQSEIKAGKILSYFLYNSVVFVSQKIISVSEI